jgi:hypothetical protein
MRGHHPPGKGQPAQTVIALVLLAAALLNGQLGPRGEPKFPKAGYLDRTSIRVTPLAAQSRLPAYRISPRSAIAKGSPISRYSTINRYTRTYYLLRSYMELFEARGGGTLALAKGTYVIPTSVSIPSNTTIKLEDGVRIVKGTRTGTSRLPVSVSVFAVVPPSKARMSGAIGGYNGSHDVTISGSGNVTLDLVNYPRAIGLAVGHARRIQISGISFANMTTGHFIEMDATDTATISGCQFKYGNAVTATANREAINLDTPDPLTHGFTALWSKNDRTPNRNVTIRNNYFYGLDRAIGTHSFSPGKMHTNISILNNRIKNMRNDPIRVMNWQDSTIQGNVIDGVAGGAIGKRGILASGAVNPNFTENSFCRVDRVIQLLPYKNQNIPQYGTIYNQLSSGNRSTLAANGRCAGTASNDYQDVPEPFIRISNVWNYYTNQEKLMLDN